MLLNFAERSLEKTRVFQGFVHVVPDVINQFVQYL
jgi:hypothetical protein